ncbi:hypothetical protein TNCV_4814211 [Trichonephila clavipes]|nr:hypothetical protein TNCV_4814211 [Trichonephila clavipes]
MELCLQCKRRLEKKNYFLEIDLLALNFFGIDSLGYDWNRFKNRSFSERIAIPRVNYEDEIRAGTTTPQMSISRQCENQWCQCHTNVKINGANVTPMV